MIAPIRLAIAYWAGIFALAFLLGIARTLWLAARIGELPAVALEVPVILGASWLWARLLLRVYPLSAPQTLAMGAAAFILLIASEAALARLFGGTVEDWLAGMASPAGALGLAGQAGFGLIPWLAARRRD